MALLFMDGFEHYASGDLAEKYEYSSGNVSSSYARTGTKCLSSDTAIGKAVSTSSTTCIIGLGHLQTASWGSTITINSGGFASSGYWQMVVVLVGDGSVEVRRGGSSGTLLGSAAAGTLRKSVWNYVEVKAVIHDSTGAVTVKVNGATVVTVSSEDTQYQTATGWTNVQVNTGTGAYVDDFYICDGSGSQNNDFIGECRVVTLLPSTGNGSNTDFTCSSSTDHGALVDEATPNDDTDYVYSSTVNHVDSWNYPALGYTGTIKGVQMSLSAKKTDSGTRAIAAVTRPASTNRVHGTNHYLGTGYTYWLSIWELNPEDSAAWEVADVDGAEFGVKVTV